MLLTDSLSEIEELLDCGFVYVGTDYAKLTDDIG